ncbi:6-carboxytetrahydropterin synthase [Anaerosporobacter sp.]|uniref:6-carboxytetrahydropterin synthase n=1 Tax=Anaerosporobacter sp. TaxID=1872529 RepID=UPI00286FA6AC|nr:6-carboxytetrahydropterin synthase [Anaerosporobacter sp.]
MDFYSQYKFKFYLNATHAIYIDGKCGAPHPHTWEIILHTVKMEEEFIRFHEVEEQIEGYLEKYQNRFINEIPPFDILNPTLEYITQFMLEQFQNILNPTGWVIFTIEVSETPTRSYIISTVENNCITQLMKENHAKKIIEDSF